MPGKKPTVQSDVSKTSAEETPAAKAARKKRTVRNFPASTIEEAVDFAREIFKIGSGQPVKRLTLFDSIGKSPDSSASRQLIVNAGRYGLTKGGYQAEKIELTETGRKCVDDEFSRREVSKARIEAGITSVEPFKSLYDSVAGS